MLPILRRFDAWVVIERLRLIYNAPLEYADLILNGDPKKYLKAVTVYRPFEN